MPQTWCSSACPRVLPGRPCRQTGQTPPLNGNASVGSQTHQSLVFAHTLYNLRRKNSAAELFITLHYFSQFILNLLLSFVSNLNAIFALLANAVYQSPNALYCAGLFKHSTADGLRESYLDGCSAFCSRDYRHSGQNKQTCLFNMIC